jgi:peptidoglycan/xylan/chitin deacetylase (PgdA/CDA1 family)
MPSITNLGLSPMFGSRGVNWAAYWSTIRSDEYQAIYDEMIDKPTGLQLAVQNYVTYNLIDKGLWTKLDRFRFYGVHSNDNNEADLDWLQPADSDNLMVGTYGTFASGTEGWSRYGTNIREVVDGALKITCVDNISGAYFYANSSDKMSEYVRGNAYRVRMKIKVSSGTAKIRSSINTANAIEFTNTDYEWKELFLIGGLNLGVGITMEIGQIVYIDEYTVQRSNYCKPINNPGWTEGRGYKGIAENDTYIDALYNLTYSANHFTQDSNCHIIYLLGKDDTSENTGHGALGGGTTDIKHGFYPNYIHKEGIVCYNNNKDEFGNVLSEVRGGMYINNRTASNKVQLWKNKKLLIDSTQETEGMASRAFASLAADIVNTEYVYPDLYNNDEIFVEAYGSGLSDSEIEDMFDIINFAATKLGINEFPNKIAFDEPLLMISIDGNGLSNYSRSYPIFLEKGVKATYYSWTDNIGYAGAYTWSNMIDMYNNGMDMQCHGKDHIRETDNTEEEMRAKYEAVDAAFIAHGLPAPKHHAYPFGTNDADLREITADYRLTARNWKYIETYFNIQYRDLQKYNFGTMLLDDYVDSESDPLPFDVDAFEDVLDEAVLKNGLVSIMSHGCRENPDYQSGSTSEYMLGHIIDMALSKGIRIITVSELYELL